MSANDTDNRPLYAPFQLLPSKKVSHFNFDSKASIVDTDFHTTYNVFQHYPDYYDIISNPIDLKTIGNKIQQNKYLTLNELEQDLLLMTKNACIFNEPGSQIYKDAKALRKLIQTKKIEVEHGKGSPGKSSERIRYGSFHFK